MNKKGILNLELLKSFFDFRLNTWIIVSSIVILTIIYLYFLSFRPVMIFPGRNDLQYDFYTDSANGGNSTIIYHNVSDNIIDLVFELKDGFLYPYVGINISDKNDSVFNMAPYNRLCIEISEENTKSIGLGIFAGNVYNNTNANEKEVCFYENLDIAPERKKYTVDPEMLKVADWWYAVNKVPTDERFEPDLKYIYRINIGPAHTLASDVIHSLRIYSISFERDNAHLIFVLISVELILIFLLALIHYIRVYKALSVTITYKAVDIENEKRQINSFLDYINNNFQDPHLTLKHVSSQTGINPRRVAASIQQSFGCNFKTYVNRLRISESKRLLKGSELNMGEIAFKVGFNNQTHFNRVFKSIEGISPSEFLQKKQQ
jgi:AraC-like DNA-binding protein